jgi:hypothetical protein
MAFKVGQDSIAGGYIGSSSASAIYIGAVLAWSAATPTPPTPPVDPCEGYGSQEECDCAQNGGTWDGVECHYDEPLSATTVALSVDKSVASAVTVTFYKMYNSNPMDGGEWTENEVLGTFDLEVSIGAETIWELASSSITSAIASAELLGDWGQGEEYKLSVVSPLLDGNCEPDTAYAFRAVAHTYDGGMIKAKCKDINTLDENIYSNAELSIDYDDVSVIRTLTITDLPDFNNMSDQTDNWTVEINDSEKFSFNMSKHYDMGEDDWIEDVTFDGYDNPNVTYNLSGRNLIVYCDWDEYDGQGAGEYTLYMKFFTNDCQYDDDTHVAGEAQLQFTGHSVTIQFDEVNPICETYLILDIQSIPNDGAAHEYRVANSDNETISILKIDTSDWSHETLDDPDGYGHGFYTDEFDDQGDLSQGFARWKIKGQFNGKYYIYVDSIQLETAIPDYDGSEMVAYVDVATDTMTTLSCYEEWDCVQNNPTCTWNSNTRECECGGV